MSGLEFAAAVYSAICIVSKALEIGDQLLGAADEMMVARELVSTISSTMDELSERRTKLSHLLPQDQKERIDDMLSRTKRFTTLIDKLVKSDDHIRNSSNVNRAKEAIMWKLKGNKRVAAYQSVLMCLHGTMIAAQNELGALKINSEKGPRQTYFKDGHCDKQAKPEGHTCTDQHEIRENLHQNETPPSYNEFLSPESQIDVMESPPSYDNIYTLETRAQVVQGLDKLSKEEELEDNVIYLKDLSKAVTDFRRFRGSYSEGGLKANLEEINRKTQEVRAEMTHEAEKLRRGVTWPDTQYSPSFVSAMSADVRKKIIKRNTEPLIAI